MTNAAYRTTPGSSDLRRARLRRVCRAARGDRPRAPTALARLRGQGGVSRRVRHPARARSAGRNPRPTRSSSSFPPPRRRTPRFRGTSGCAGSASSQDGRAGYRNARRSAPRSSTNGAASCSSATATNTGDWWVTPGGGREAGEADEQTLRRELEEEIGLVGFDLGPLLWELRRLDAAGARFRELSLPRLPRACRSLRAAASHRGARGSLVLACGAEDGVDAAARSRGAAQLRQRFVIGVRRSRPNAFGRSRTPGGACRRLYSARSMSATARATTSGSKPSALSSSSERSSST